MIIIKSNPLALANGHINLLANEGGDTDNLSTLAELKCNADVRQAATPPAEGCTSLYARHGAQLAVAGVVERTASDHRHPNLARVLHAMQDMLGEVAIQREQIAYTGRLEGRAAERLNWLRSPYIKLVCERLRHIDEHLPESAGDEAELLQMEGYVLADWLALTWRHQAELAAFSGYFEALGAAPAYFAPPMEDVGDAAPDDEEVSAVETA